MALVNSKTRDALQKTIDDCQQRGVEIDFATTMQTIKQFYNGYCFCPYPQTAVYNATLVLYFLDHLNHDCRYPQQLLDSNLAMDRDRIKYVAQLPNGAELIENIWDESQPVVVDKLHDRFGVDDMLRHVQEEHELASLLYYLGVLTQADMTPFGDVQLRIPNLVIRSLYVEKLREILLPEVQYNDYRQAKQQFLAYGNLQPLCDFLAPRFNVFSNRDYKWADEIAVKTAFLMLLFDDRLYIIDSEPELQRCYADLTLIIRPDARKYEILDHLLEFKFVTLKKVNLTGAEAQALSDDELCALSAVQQAFSEATTQLEQYQPILQQRYAGLRLQTSVVVAVGFERLLWKKVD